MNNAELEAALSNAINAVISRDKANAVIDQITGFDGEEVEDFIAAFAKHSLEVGMAMPTDVDKIIQEMHNELSEAELQKTVAKIARPYYQGAFP